jgi:hypothetical protein
MTTPYPLFSQVVLTEDFPDHHLQRGAIGIIVEHYPMPNPEEDGYSLEGFNLPNVTLEVSASQIMSLAQWQAATPPTPALPRNINLFYPYTSRRC